MTQIKINMIAETVAIIDAELNKHNDVITQVMKDVLKEHICYAFEPDMENIKAYSELTAFFEKIRAYIQSLFKERINPYTGKVNPNGLGGLPLTDNPKINPFKQGSYILCGQPEGVTYRG